MPDNLFYRSWMKDVELTSKRYDLAQYAVWLDAENILPIWKSKKDWPYSDLPQPIPPWNMCFVEWSIQSQFGYKTLDEYMIARGDTLPVGLPKFDRVGVSCVTIPPASLPEGKLKKHLLEGFPFNSHFYLSFHIYLYNSEINGLYGTETGYCTGLDALGNLSSTNNNFLVAPPAGQDPEATRQAFLESIEFLQVPLLAFSLCNCSNVTVNEEEQTTLPRPERRRQQKEGVPLYKYKILDIKPTSRKMRAVSEATREHRTLPLHVVRGHFKEFDEHPLFGKVKGRFWWSSCTKGSIESGVVDKDYRMDETNTEGGE